MATIKVANEEGEIAEFEYKIESLDKDENIYRGQALCVRGMSGEFCLRGARLALHGAVLFPEEQEKELLCIRRNQICRI